VCLERMLAQQSVATALPTRTSSKGLVLSQRMPHRAAHMRSQRNMIDALTARSGQMRSWRSAEGAHMLPEPQGAQLCTVTWVANATQGTALPYAVSFGKPN
jgi:hypothetical protein